MLTSGMTRLRPREWARIDGGGIFAAFPSVRPREADLSRSLELTALAICSAVLSVRSPSGRSFHNVAEIIAFPRRYEVARYVL